jgi:hypothetical protein
MYKSFKLQCNSNGGFLNFLFEFVVVKFFAINCHISIVVVEFLHMCVTHAWLLDSRRGSGQFVKW